MNVALKFLVVTVGFILFGLSAFMLFEPSSDPTGHFVYISDLAIFNPDNAEPLNSNLEIAFITKGNMELQVATVVGETEFVSLTCDGEIFSPVVREKVIIMKDYHCYGKGIVTVKIVSQEVVLELLSNHRIHQVKNIAP